MTRTNSVTVRAVTATLPTSVEKLGGRARTVLESDVRDKYNSPVGGRSLKHSLPNLHSESTFLTPM